MTALVGLAVWSELFTVSHFPTSKPAGPACGQHSTTTWSDFADLFRRRREGVKDGPCFSAATFALEPDGRVRRLKRNLVSRTAVALDVETNKATGEIPPALADVVDQAKNRGWACLGYTSHNHRPTSDIRYRLVIPLSEPIAHDLPAPEIIAEKLNLLGVLDTSKLGASSLFFLPSCPPGHLALHEIVLVPGNPIRAAGISQAAARLLTSRQVEADRIADAAHAEAAARRAARIAAGFDANDSLIEKLRSRLDLESVLSSHGYGKAGGKFRHPNSSSGCYGADIKVFGGIERVFSHNGTDPLHAGNLPAWCGVTALDAFDAVVILDFAGDRKRAMRAMAEAAGLTRAEDRKAVARLMFRLLRQRAPQEVIKAAAFAEGDRIGLPRGDVISVAQWVASQVGAGAEP